MSQYILAIDQGTTSSRAIVFDQAGVQQAVHQVPIQRFYPDDGWVEQDANEIRDTTITCCREVIASANLKPKDILSIGISNQRETTIVWVRKTGKVLYHAIVWQDRRTAAFCKQLARDKQVVDRIQQKTGLLLDPYFCASKICWILDNVDGARAQAQAGDLLFGTVDCYLMWCLTGGKSHKTDVTNASRTLLFNIQSLDWDQELLDIFGIPKSMLPEVVDCDAQFGISEKNILGAEIPITGVAGDQQAAMVGQACFEKGMVKCTYGTGAFMMFNLGEQPIVSSQRLLTTIGYRLQGKLCYALEGSIFIAGAVVQWLRDQLHLFKNAADTLIMVARTTSNNGVYFVPAFTGLAAPYWDPLARGSLFGLTQSATSDHIVRAALESVSYQTADLLKAMTDDATAKINLLRVDGGMTNNSWLMQFLSDILNTTVQKPRCIETSALGAAFVSGLGIGLYASLDDIASLWQIDNTYQPTMSASERERALRGWHKAVDSTLKFSN